MKPIENRKHHYIPQLLLRNFSSEKRETIFAFDKKDGTHFQVAIRDAAAEKGYNSFSTKEASGCIEDTFTSIETNAAPVLQKILTSGALHEFSVSEREKLHKLVIAQMLRSKNHRAISAQIGQIMRDLATEGTDKLKEWVGPYDPEREKQVVLAGLEQTLLQFIPYMMDKDLILFTAENPPLLIGDSPLIMTNTFNVSTFRGTTGLTSPGVEMYLPLSPKMALGFMCRSIADAMDRLVFSLGRDAPIAVDYLMAFDQKNSMHLIPENVEYLRFASGSKRRTLCIFRNFRFSAGHRNGQQRSINAAWKETTNPITLHEINGTTLILAKEICLEQRDIRNRLVTCANRS